MMVPRIGLYLDQPFPETYGEGWGFVHPAGSLQFAERVAADGAATRLAMVGDPKKFHRIQGLGVIIRKPRLLELGVVSFDDPLSAAWRDAEVDIAASSDGTMALVSFNKAGTLARKRAAKGAEFITLGNAIHQAGLAKLSGDLRTIWQTKAPLGANEGWSLMVMPVAAFDDVKANAYVAATFGQRYILGINLQGTAVLSENLGSASAPKWVQRKTMNVQGLSLRDTFTVTCFCVGGRYLYFEFSSAKFTGRGARLTSYAVTRDFLFDVRDDGAGTPFDAGINQHVCSPAGKLGIAVNSSGVDYRFLPQKVVFPSTPETAVFTAESLNNPLPDNVPAVAAFGYAGNLGPGAEGAGTMTVGYANPDGSAWNASTSTLLCPSVTMGGDSTGRYSPELWWLEGRADPQVWTPPYTAYDASAEWTYLRIQKTVSQESPAAEIKLREDSRYAALHRRPGPVRISIDGAPVWDGYCVLRRPTVGIRTVEADYEARDMWQRLDVPIGTFEAIDGKGVGEIVARLLRRAGFGPEHVEVLDDDLQGLRFEEFSEPQSLKIYNADALVSEALRDIVKRNCVQGFEGVRVRWTGTKWRVYLAPTGFSGSLPAPATVFSSTDLVGPQGSDRERWDAGWLRITSLLEFDSAIPEFNSLIGLTSKAAGDASTALKTILDTHPSVLNDPTCPEFEGRRRRKTATQPEITATTMDALEKQVRFMYDVEQRQHHGLSFQGEFQPFVDADQECAVVGYDPLARRAVSYGVYRIVLIDAEITADETPGEGVESPAGTGAWLRSWEWTAGYRLLWLRRTPDDFTGGVDGGPPIPMYAGPESTPPEDPLR